MLDRGGVKWHTVALRGGRGDSGEQRGDAVLLGEVRHTLDDKGRVTLPSNSRQHFAGGCVITRGRDGCLWIFPNPEWDRVAAALRELSTAQREIRSARRFFLGSASEETPDSQGRIRVPASLRTHANLSKDVVISGEADRLEIWDAATWDGMQSELEEASEAEGLPI